MRWSFFLLTRTPPRGPSSARPSPISPCARGSSGRPEHGGRFLETQPPGSIGARPAGPRARLPRPASSTPCPARGHRVGPSREPPLRRLPTKADAPPNLARARSGGGPGEPGPVARPWRRSRRSELGPPSRAAALRPIADGAGFDDLPRPRRLTRRQPPLHGARPTRAQVPNRSENPPHGSPRTKGRPDSDRLCTFLKELRPSDEQRHENSSA